MNKNSQCRFHNGYVCNYTLIDQLHKTSNFSVHIFCWISDFKSHPTQYRPFRWRNCFFYKLKKYNYGFTLFFLKQYISYLVTNSPGRLSTDYKLLAHSCTIQRSATSWTKLKRWTLSCCTTFSSSVFNTPVMFRLQCIHPLSFTLQPGQKSRSNYIMRFDVSV